MKRIANQVAVQTICYAMCGDQKIRIENYENLWDAGRGYRGHIVFEGEQEQLNDYRNARIAASQVRSITAVNNVIVLRICISSDQY